MTGMRGGARAATMLQIRIPIHCGVYHKTTAMCMRTKKKHCDSMARRAYKDYKHDARSEETGIGLGGERSGDSDGEGGIRIIRGRICGG